MGSKGVVQGSGSSLYKSNSMVNITNRSVKPIFKLMSLLGSIILEGNPRMLDFEGQAGSSGFCKKSNSI